MSAELDRLVRRIAEVLKAAGAAEVYVFGSAASGSVRAHSDVDIAVSGLPSERFFGAMGRASEAAGRPVDLLDLDRPSPLVRYLKASKELKRVG